MVGESKFDINRVTKNIVINVKVRGGRRFRWRMFIVGKLLKLANWVSPMGIVIEITDKADSFKPSEP